MGSALTTPYDFTKKVEGDLTVFAKWRGNTDVLRDAANGLTAETAFQFAQGDTWECVTGDFMMLGVGESGVRVAWTSSDESAVRIEGSGETVKGIVIRPEIKDTSVVITATISEGELTLTKTFLLVVKQKDVAKQETRGTTERVATVQIGSNTDTDTVYRTVLDDGTNIDVVVVTPKTVQRLVEQSGDADVAEVIMDRYDADPANEFAFEVSADIISMLTEKDLGLTLNSPEGSVTLSTDELKRASDNCIELYFHFVPVPDESDEAREAFQNDATMFSMMSGATSEIFGMPRIIQTNMEGFKTTVRFPLDGIDETRLSDPDFLASLCIYAEHDDGTTELIEGEIIYEDGAPGAIEFKISSFSRFQIVSVQETNSPWLLIGLCIAGVIILIALVIILITVCRRRKLQQTEYI